MLKEVQKNATRGDGDATGEQDKKPGQLPSASTLYDELDAHSWSLKALGELIKSSHLWMFADEDLGGGGLHVEVDGEADTLRWGLSQLFDLYLDKQERILRKFLDEHWESDYVSLMRAESGIADSKAGMWNTVEVTVEHVSGYIKDLDIIIDRSAEFRDRAIEARQAGLEFVEGLKSGKYSPER